MITDSNTSASSADARESQNFIRALARGLAAIEAMGAHADGVTLSELAGLCDLDRATTRRILLTLTELGYVRGAANRFLLAPRVLNLGYAYLSSIPFWELANPVMERLVRTLHESCSVAMLDGTDAVYVARVRSTERMIDVSRTIGSRIPAYCTSLGRVLLAAETVDQREALLKQSTLVAHTKHTIVDRRKLMKILSEVREQGWALVDQEMEVGLRSLAVPVTDRTGKVVAALNTSVQPTRVSTAELLKKYLPALQGDRAGTRARTAGQARKLIFATHLTAIRQSVLMCVFRTNVRLAHKRRSQIANSASRSLAMHTVLTPAQQELVERIDGLVFTWRGETGGGP
jgi:IclR family pca regulon transcriptional regulator